MSLLDDIKDLPASKWGMAIRPDLQPAVKSLSFKARSFIFDDEASAILGAFIRDCPDIIADQIDFAVYPYETTYIELNLRRVHQVMGKPTSIHYDDPDADQQVGFLIHGGTIYNLTNSSTKPGAMVTMFGLADVSGDYGRAPRPALLQGDEDLKERFLLGHTFHNLTRAQREKFARRFIALNMTGMEWGERVGAQLQAHAGEARTLVAALLMLYQKKHITLTEKGPVRALSRGKQRVYMAHSVVSIHLSGEKEIRKAFHTGTHASPRRHEVRFTFAHRGGTTACEHNWIPRHDQKTGEVKKQWDCPVCGRFRWFRPSHLRGDGSKGFVTKRYEVKK
jgi:hypothetical protein